MKLDFIGDIQARAIAEDFFSRVGWKGMGNAPVTDVETIALRAGYPTSTIPNLKSVCDSYGTGFWNIQKQCYEILIDEDSYERWYKSAQFTIAEELGHLLVHRDYLKDIKSLEARVTFEGSLDENTFFIFEKQAKNVASALLLPSARFDPYVLTWSVEHKDTLLKNYFPNENDLALHISQELSPKLNLSQQIVQRALKRAVPVTIASLIVSTIGINLGRP